jgi:hypothetical protein
MADWTQPINSTVYTLVLSELKGRDTDAGAMFDPATVSPYSTNLPNNTIRWNSVNSRWEILNGTWGALDTEYDINVTQLKGLDDTDFLKIAPAGNQTITNGKLILDIDAGAVLDLKGGTADEVYLQFYANTVAQSTRTGYIGFFGAAEEHLDIVNEYTNGDIKLITNGTGSVDITGVATAATFEPNGNTSVGDLAAVGYSASNGLTLTGQGSNYDVVIKNDNAATVLRVPTGTLNVEILGALSTQGHIRPFFNSTYDLGSTSLRWDDLWVDSITCTLAGAFGGDVTAGTITLDTSASRVLAGDGTDATAGIVFNATATGNPTAIFQQNGTTKAYLQYTDSGDIFEIDADNSITLAPSNTTALTLDNSGNATFAGTITVDSIVQPKIKIIQLGDWNMDTTASHGGVTHGLTLANIRSISVLIRNDANTSYYDFATSDVGSGVLLWATSTDIEIVRSTGGQFDHANYNSTSYNRGWVTITYV